MNARGRTGTRSAQDGARAGAEPVVALAALVATEDAAIFGIGAAGGRLAVTAPRSAGAALLATAFDVHRLRRDQLVALIRSGGVTAPEPQVAYSLGALRTETQALQLAAQLEAGCTRAYRLALAELTGVSLRTLAVEAVLDGATRSAALLTAAGLALNQATTALPGN